MKRSTSYKTLRTETLFIKP